MTDSEVRQAEIPHDLAAPSRPRVRVLGPVEVVVNGDVYPLRPMARRLLAVLASVRGRIMRTEQVIDLLWPEGAPASAAKTLQTHVVHLRRALGHDSISFRAAGYALALEVVDLDAVELEQRMKRADRAVIAGQIEDALTDLLAAMALVRGAPFDEFAFDEFAEVEAARLSELASRCIEFGADCAVRLGKASTMVAPLEGLVREQPLRESAWALLVGVLDASGRPSDANRAGERATDILRRELGAPPSRMLKEALTAIRSREPQPFSGGAGAGAGWRSEISVPNISMVIRKRLLRCIGNRFTARLTVIQAGAGFGKSTALTQSFDENRFTRLGEDRYLRCASTESTPRGLAVALCGLFAVPVPDELERVANLIASKIWASAPQHVSIILDDAHVLWALDENEFLQRVLKALPMNGHLVLSTRTQVPLALSAIVADEKRSTITEADLCFTDDERVEFCALRGVSSVGFSWVWPAMAELALRGGSTPSNYLHEILQASQPTEHDALRSVVALGGADEELASTFLGGPANLDIQLARLPLVARDQSGSWTAHAMWSDHVEGNPGASTSRKGVLAASELLLKRNDYSRAVHLLQSAGLDHEMVRAMGAACRGFEPAVSYLELNEWLGLLPESLSANPVALLVRAFALSRGDQHLAQDAMVAAALALADTSDRKSELNALTQVGRLGIRSGYLPDSGRWYARLRALAEQGHHMAALIAKIGTGVIAFESGDEEQAWNAFSSAAGHNVEAVEEVEEVDGLKEVEGVETAGDLAKIASYLASMSALLLGRANDALLLADRAQSDASSTASSTQSIVLQARGFALFAAGDLEGSARVNREVYQLSLATNFAFNTRSFLAWGAALHAFGGHSERAKEAMAEIVDVAEPDAWHTLASCVIAICDGREKVASAVLTDVALARTMLDHRVITLAPALAFVLLPQTRPFWMKRSTDLAHVLGSRHDLSMTAAHALLRARSGERVGEIGQKLAVPMLRSVLPLPWGMELAVALAVEDQMEAATMIAASYGSMGSRWLFSHRPPSNCRKRAALALRVALPPQPAGAVVVQLLGTGSMRCETGPNIATVLTGGRALELIAFLALRGRVERGTVRAALWPNHISSEALLREALHQVRAVTEPHVADHTLSDVGWLIEGNGNCLQLCESPDLRVDVREFERLIAGANEALAASLPARGLERLLEAVGSATDATLMSGTDVGDWILPFRARWRATVADACTRAAALLAANDDAPQALRLAQRALALDPGSQSAWCVEIDARINLGDRVGAKEVGERCESELQRLGVAADGVTAEAITRSRAHDQVNQSIS